MSGVHVVVGGDPTDEEAAAICAAVVANMGSAPADADPRPAAYRSPWRRAAIEQAAERPPLLYGVGAPMHRRAV